MFTYLIYSEGYSSKILRKDNTFNFYHPPSEAIAFPLNHLLNFVTENTLPKKQHFIWTKANSIWTQANFIWTDSKANFFILHNILFKGSVFCDLSHTSHSNLKCRTSMRSPYCVFPCFVHKYFQIQNSSLNMTLTCGPSFF